MSQTFPYEPRLVGTTGDLYQGSIASTARKEAVFSHRSTAPSPPYSPSFHFSSDSNYFKSAQWSPDGTTLFTTSATPALRAFILPPQLLSPPHPYPLTPYSLQSLPEPVNALAIHPSYTLSSPPTTLILVSPRALPIRLVSPFAEGILASYPLVSPTTEAWTAPHSLLFSPLETNNFFAGSESCVSFFDAGRDGEGPVCRMRTAQSRRARGGGGGGMKGIVSALGINKEGLLAAGTFGRWVGLYDGFGRGGEVGCFTVGADEEEETRGVGVTQVLWSGEGRYLCVVERGCDGVGVWDIRGTGKRLAWLRGREARTQQRLGVDVKGGEVWAGGTDGTVRIWEGLGMREGVVESSWDFKAHDDAVSSTTLHPVGSVLATCSGQRHYPDSVGEEVEGSESGRESETSSKCSSTLTSEPSPAPSIGHSFQVSSAVVGDNSLKVWAL